MPRQPRRELAQRIAGGEVERRFKVLTQRRRRDEARCDRVVPGSDLDRGVSEAAPTFLGGAVRFRAADPSLRGQSKND